MTARPDMITWVGPEGFSVRLDEDGVCLIPGSRPLEEMELNRLLEIVAAAKAARDSTSELVPRPPTLEQLKRFRRASSAAYAKRAAGEAIDAAYGVGDDSTPF